MQKTKVFVILAAVIFLITAGSVSAQSNQVLDNLLLAQEANFGEAVYMIAVGSGIADEDMSVADAVQLVSENRWNKAGKGAGDKITLGEASFIIMKALKIRGGLMYMLFPSPRYAVRELDYLEFLNVEPHPRNKITGKDFLDILNKAIAYKEDK